jgi:hypothetical protein
MQLPESHESASDDTGIYWRDVHGYRVYFALGPDRRILSGVHAPQTPEEEAHVITRLGNEVDEARRRARLRLVPAGRSRARLRQEHHQPPRLTLVRGGRN